MKLESGVRPVLTALLFTATVSVVWGSEEIAQQEELECQVCHADPESELLTDQGLYFQYLGTLDGYDQVMGRFGSCTYCHVDEPGSLQLTQEGLRFRWMMEDMTGLQAWLAANHPTSDAEEEPAESE